jgi:drug/metabolite transporter (DMT)-like permease
MLTGVALVIVGVTCYAIMDGLGVFLSESQSIVQIVWARYMFALPVVLFVAARHGIVRTYASTRRPFIQVLMGLFPALASFSVAGGFGLLDLAELTAITFASPLLVVALSAPLLREHTTLHDWIGVIGGFVGILLVVRPGADALAWAAIFPLGCAFFFALYQISMRFVGREDDPVSTLAWSITTGLVVTIPLVFLDWRPASPGAWVAMIASGLVFGAAQFCLIAAFRRAAPALLTPFTYVQIVPAVLIGIAAFGNWPDLWTIVGTVLVIAAGIYVLDRRRRGPAPGQRSEVLGDELVGK